MTLSTPDIGQAEFQLWVHGVLRARALGQMVRPDTFDRAMSAARFLPNVIEQQARQPEFGLSIWEYLDIAASEERVRQGRQMLRRHRDLFIDIERRFHVEPEVVTAIWGLETGFGVIRGKTPTLSALGTLAWKGKRSSFFEDQLISALRIVQSGHVSEDQMVGSWAGAMGHGQFLPSSFLDFAVDFDGDGRRDIWSDDPTDALASIANYLAKHGWRRGQPWGYEVTLPEGFDYALVGLDRSLPTASWSALDVMTASGTRLPDYGPGSLLLPAGASGVAVMVLRNTHVILRYNKAEAYALGIGLLADRVGGGRGFVGSWPTDDRVLSRDEISEAQVLLTALGYSTRGVDGLRGPNTTLAARMFQSDQGLVADGYLSGDLLDRLRKSRGA